MESTKIKSISLYLEQQERKPRCSFIICGSVDDGKSTLIGRLLYETKKIASDQLEALKKDSKRYGSENELEFALLVDGLEAEQEQGITIDVAYRYFDSAKKKFTLIDAPGHEQYTCNMVTGATQADAALLLIDARHGIKEQTKRHSYILSLIGIKHVLVVVNKMDLVHYSEERFRHICDEGEPFFNRCNFTTLSYIPISALQGENLITSSMHFDWYQAPSLLTQLDSLPTKADLLKDNFRFSVQNVTRPHQDFRGYNGRILSGTLSPGQKIKIASSGITAAIKSIHLGEQLLPRALAGQSVLLQLNTEVDVSRGDVLVDADWAIRSANQFQVSLIWLDSEPLVAGRNYLLKIGSRHTSVVITRIKQKVNIINLEALPAQSLVRNEVGECCIQTNQAIVFEPYVNNKELGSFILIDRLTNATVGAGMIRFALQRSGTLITTKNLISKNVRAKMKNQTPRVFWFTGLSGAGKSTIAQALEQKLVDLGHHTFILDGDNLRQGLCKDLGFTVADRVENVRRVAETAKLMTEAGLIVLVALISPFARDRMFARSLFAKNEFVEIFVQISLSTAKKRDSKGLYAKANSGLLTNFTGIDSLYEEPMQPELSLNTEILEVQDCVASILNWMTSSAIEMT